MPETTVRQLTAHNVAALRANAEILPIADGKLGATVCTFASTPAEAAAAIQAAMDVRRASHGGRDNEYRSLIAVRNKLQEMEAPVAEPTDAPLTAQKVSAYLRKQGYKHSWSRTRQGLRISQISATTVNVSADYDLEHERFAAADNLTEVLEEGGYTVDRKDGSHILSVTVQSKS